MKDVLIILQARTGSTRLPEKVLKPFYGELSIFEIIARKISGKFDYTTVLATTLNVRDDSLVALASGMGLETYRGSEDDVLKRFIDCAERFGKSVIVRVCCDNPFVDMNLLDELILSHLKHTAEYSSFISVKNIPAIKTHYGIFAEVVQLSALKKIAELTNEMLYHEHVTNYIYSNPGLFSLNFIKMPSRVEEVDFRLTLDTIEDWNLLQELYAKCAKKNENFTWNDALDELKNDEKGLSIMHEQIKRFSK